MIKPHFTFLVSPSSAIAAESSRNRKGDECNENEMVKLQSADRKTFDVAMAVALQSGIIKKAMEDMGSHNLIPLPNVYSEILEKIIKYCEYHVEHPARPMETIEDIDKWDVEFLNVDRLTLSEIACAAHYLDIKSLVDMVCKTIADIIVGLETCENVRREFNIANDLTPQEEEEVRRKYQWAFE